MRPLQLRPFQRSPSVHCLRQLRLAAELHSQVIPGAGCCPVSLVERWQPATAAVLHKRQPGRSARHVHRALATSVPICGPLIGFCTVLDLHHTSRVARSVGVHVAC